MKYIISFVATLIISSSANNVDDCFDSCQQIENSCLLGCNCAGHSDPIDRAGCFFDCHNNLNPCYSACYNDSTSTSKAFNSGDTKSLSLRESPTLLTDLDIEEVTNQVQDINLSSSAVPKNCIYNCQLVENICVSGCRREGHISSTDRSYCGLGCSENLHKCYSNCLNGGSNVNEISKDTKISSLRRSKDINLIQDEGQCKSIYNQCSRNADCCGEMECIDFGANGFSIFLCDRNREDIPCRSKGSDCSRNGDCCGNLICRDFGYPFTRLCDDNE